MPFWLLALVGGSVATAAAGYFIDKSGEAVQDTGEGVNAASNGAVKLIIASAVAFYALKKAKVI